MDLQHPRAVGDAHAIVVTSTTPSELTLLHELAHFIGAMDHGPRFQEVYARLAHQNLSALHGNTLASIIAWRLEESGVRVRVV